MSGDKQKRASVELAPDLHRGLRLWAVEAGITLQQLVDSILRKAWTTRDSRKDPAA